MLAVNNLMKAPMLQCTESTTGMGAGGPEAKLEGLHKGPAGGTDILLMSGSLSLE